MLDFYKIISQLVTPLSDTSTLDFFFFFSVARGIKQTLPYNQLLYKALKRQQNAKAESVIKQ